VQTSRYRSSRPLDGEYDEIANILCYLYLDGGSGANIERLKRQSRIPGLGVDEAEILGNPAGFEVKLLA
jgi:hypothetical protein